MLHYKETTKTIYTLGTSNRPIQDFFSVLEAFDIRGIVDVRRFPKSRRFPHFCKEKIEGEAKNRNLSYHWLGGLLGGFRKGGYETYKKESTYTRGLEEVERLASKHLVTILCAERLPWRCHRLHISNSLNERGWNVIHIIDQDRTWQPKNESG